MKTIYFYILAAMWLFTLAACETRIDIELEDKARVLVVNGLLTANEPPMIELTKSMSLLDPDRPISVDGATVQIFEDGNLTATLSPKKTFLYEDSWYSDTPPYSHTDSVWTQIYSSADFKPQAGKNYKVQVSHPDIAEIAEASVRIPEKPEVTGIALDSVIIPGDEYYPEPRTEYFYTIKIKDLPAVKNYYLIGGYYTQYITADVYDEATQEITKKQFVSTNPLYLYNNADNDLLDFDQLWIFNGILVKDALQDGKEIIVKATDSNAGWGGYSFADSTRLYIQIKSLSEEYYRYANTLQAQQNSQDNPFAEKVAVYSNITGGYGILNSVNAYTDSSFVFYGNPNGDGGGKW